jgi:hypothetical protein
VEEAAGPVEAVEDSEDEAAVSEVSPDGEAQVAGAGAWCLRTDRRRGAAEEAAEEGGWRTTSSAG